MGFNFHQVMGINFSGQGRYLGKTCDFQYKPRVDFLSITGYFHCDNPEHSAKQCPKPKRYTHATARLLENFSQKETKDAVHAVLVFMDEQVQDENDENGEHIKGTDDDDAAIFNSPCQDKNAAIHLLLSHSPNMEAEMVPNH